MTALDLTPDEALALADQWCAGLTMDADSKGWGAILLVLAEEVRRLRADVEAAYNTLPGSYYMDPPDGGDVTPLEQIRRMADDAARYRWLRNDDGLVMLPYDDYGIGPMYPSGSELDAAIDKAMEASNAG